jgi:pimeloyl-ACP methyl ester carboxylesterase
VLLALDGLHPPSMGARVSFAGGKPKVTDGPFAEAKEVLGGYWMIQVRSKDEAIAWATRCPASEDETIEIRQVQEMSDFTPEVQKAAAGRGGTRGDAAGFASEDLRRRPGGDRRPGTTQERNDAMKKLLLGMLLGALVGVPGPVSAAAAPRAVEKAPAKRMPVKSGRIPVNGLDYYYEIHGKGEPLLVLHGGLGSIDMFGPALTGLAAKRQVVAVDLHGHGRTALGSRTIDMSDMGNDMAGIVDALGFPQVDVFGYSMGGAVALRFAIQHPGKVRRLALLSAGFAQDGFFPEMLPQQAAVGAAMAEGMKETPMYKSYAAVAPHPGEFPRLLDQMGAWMRRPYDWSAEVAKLPMPVLLVYADHDMWRPEHEVKFFQLLGGGLKDAGWQREHMSKARLAILPDHTHYDVFMAPELAATVLPFLGGRSSARSWAEQVEKPK